MDSGRVCAHGFDAVGILFSDHTEDIDIYQDLPKKRTQPEIRGDRSLRYASVNQGGLYAHPVRLKKPRGPEFGFQKDHGIRANPKQRFAD
jgi:hypothetical protein